jgi:hypothetical protein
MDAAAAGGAPARLREPALRLLRRAAGRPAELRGKLARLGTVLARALDGHTLEARLDELERRGVAARRPTKLQVFVGGVDMLRFWIVPAAADYYGKQGINFRFHQLLRFVEEPASLVDPVGLFSARDGIIAHLLQVVHANPVYDLELLEMFPDGLDELERQIAAMLDGTHPRAAAIGAIVEEKDYHGKLQSFVRDWRRDPTVPPLVRSNIAANPAFAAVERTFGTLRGAMRYFAALPERPLAALRHLLFASEFRTIVR